MRGLIGLPAFALLAMTSGVWAAEVTEKVDVKADARGDLGLDRRFLRDQKLASRDRRLRDQGRRGLTRSAP